MSREGLFGGCGRCFVFYPVMLQDCMNDRRSWILRICMGVGFVDAISSDMLCWSKSFGRATNLHTNIPRYMTGTKGNQ